MGILYKDKTIKRYLDDLAAKTPTPGGGSAAALCACLAASLVSMVVNFTLGKPKYLKYERKLRIILNQSESLGKEFLRLVDLDIAAYNSKNIRNALNVPFMTARLCFEGIKLCPMLVKMGNVSLISDTALAAIFFESGFASASFNVKINLKHMNDDKLSKAITKELDRKNKVIKKLRIQVEEKVGKIIRG